MKNNEKYFYESVYKEAFGTTLRGLWLVLDSLSKESIDFSEQESFFMKRDRFLFTVKYLLENSRIRLNYLFTEEIVFLTIADQIHLIEKYWPNMDSKEESDNLDESGGWFWDRCPVGIIWIYEDGTYCWT